MKLTKVISCAMMAVFMPLATAYASHNEPVQADQLRYDARSLYQIVIYSTLGISEKNAVTQFNADVEKFENCAAKYSSASDSNQPMNHFEPTDRNGHAKCLVELRRIKFTWSKIDRYLFDTYDDYPQIYQLYFQIRNTLPL